MIKAIVFDKDGTLIDYEALWSPVTKNAVAELLTQRGIDVGCDSAQALLESFSCHGTYADTAAKLSLCAREYLGLELDFTADDLCEAYKSNLSHGRIIPMCDGLDSLLKRLKQKGLRLAVITSDAPSSAEACLKRLGVYELFDAVYADDLVHPPKPDPYYMYCFCERYGLKPEEVVMVGDMPYDMEFARKSGALSFGVKPELADCADYIGELWDLLTITEYEKSRQ